MIGLLNKVHQNGGVLDTMRFGAFGGRPRKVSGTSWRKEKTPHTAEQPRKVGGRVLRKGLLCRQGMLTMVMVTMVTLHGQPCFTTDIRSIQVVCVGGREPLVFMVSEHKRRLRELYPSCLDQFEVDDRALDAQRDSC